MELIIRLFAVAGTLLLAEHFVPGISVTNIYIALLVALVLAVLNLILKPILVILTLPITLLTLGLFVFVINAFLFWLAGYFINGFDVDGFLPALIGSLLVTIASTLVHRIFAKKPTS